MEMIRQISIFVENRAGALANVTALLGEAGIDLRSLSLADTRDFGILRIIVDQPDKACEILKENGYPYTVTEVIGVKVPDEPNGLSKVLCVLQDAKVNVEYMVAFVNRKSNRADVIFRVDNPEECLSALQSQKIEILTVEEAYAR